MSMPAWFDLHQLSNLTDSAYDDEAGLLASVAAVDQLVQAEVDAGIPENKIVVGGFSQGGAVAALTALTGSRALAGTVVLSSWVVLNHKIEQVSCLRLGSPYRRHDSGPRKQR
jgi:predicted esterase